MTLKTGPNSIRYNVSELMQNVNSKSRRKAIHTISKRRGISLQDAQFVQAKAIVLKKARAGR